MQTPEDHHAEMQGAERYAVYGVAIKNIFRVKAKMLASKATVAGAKAKAAAAANVRYTAYASDVGEGLRPVVPEWAVKATYGIAVGYVGVEVGYHTYLEAQKPDGDTARVFVHQSIFHSIASIGLPMTIIHQAVHGAQWGFKKLGRFTKWGPSLVGLALIPALPYVVDHPCEVAVDYAFDAAWPKKEGATSDKH